MLVVHHLGVSQSDRIVWLCEELGIAYELKRYDREATGAAPPEYKALHPYGTAPVIQDGKLTLGESAAIVEYICRKYGKGRLIVGPDAPNFGDYLYWFHFANGSFVPAAMMIRMQSAPPPDNRLTRAFAIVERRLGEAPYFAGAEFTAADIMMVFSLTMMRRGISHDLSGSPNTRAYLQRIGARPAFQEAYRKGDPTLVPLLT